MLNITWHPFLNPPQVEAESAVPRSRAIVDVDQVNYWMQGTLSDARAANWSEQESPARDDFLGLRASKFKAHNPPPGEPNPKLEKISWVQFEYAVDITKFEKGHRVDIDFMVGFVSVDDALDYDTVLDSAAQPVPTWGIQVSAAKSIALLGSWYFAKALTTSSQAVVVGKALYEVVSSALTANDLILSVTFRVDVDKFKPKDEFPRVTAFVHSTARALASAYNLAVGDEPDEDEASESSFEVCGE